MKTRKTISKSRFVTDICHYDNTITVFDYGVKLKEGDYFLLRRAFYSANNGYYRVKSVRGKRIEIDTSHNILVTSQSKVSTNKDTATYIEYAKFKKMLTTFSDYEKVKGFIIYYKKSMLNAFNHFFRVPKKPDGFRELEDWNVFYDLYFDLEAEGVDPPELYIQTIISLFNTSQISVKKPFPNTLRSLRHIFDRHNRNLKNNGVVEELDSFDQAVIIDIGRDLLEIKKRSILAGEELFEHEVLISDQMFFNKYTLITNRAVLDHLRKSKEGEVRNIFPHRADEMEVLYQEVLQEPVYVSFLIDAKKRINKFINDTFEKAQREYKNIKPFQVLHYISNELEQLNYNV